MKRVTNSIVLNDAWVEFSRAMSNIPGGFGLIQAALQSALPATQKIHPNVVKLDIQPEKDKGLVFMVFEK